MFAPTCAYDVDRWHLTSILTAWGLWQLLLVTHLPDSTHRTYGQEHLQPAWALRSFVHRLSRFLCRQVNATLVNNRTRTLPTSERGHCRQPSCHHPATRLNTAPVSRLYATTNTHHVFLPGRTSSEPAVSISQSKQRTSRDSVARSTKLNKRPTPSVVLPSGQSTHGMNVLKTDSSLWSMSGTCTDASTTSRIRVWNRF